MGKIIGLVVVLAVVATGCALLSDVELPDFGFDVSGVVTDGTDGIEGVQISFSGDYPAVMTDENGTWSKSGLSGAVTVTPSKEGWAFTPGVLEVSEAADDVNFTGSVFNVLFATDFSDSDPLELDPAVWSTTDFANVNYTYADGQVTMDTTTGGASFLLVQSSPMFQYWDRDPDATYTVETMLRFDKVSKYQSMNLRLQSFNVGYTVKFGEAEDDYNISLLRKPTWDAADAVVGHDANLSPVFNNGSVVAAYTEQWIPVRIVMQGGTITVYVDDVEIISYVDDDPIIRFSYGWYMWVSGLSLDSVSITEAF